MASATATGLGSQKRWNPRGFIDAFRVQVAVIWALMMRELHTRYGRDNLGFLWVMAEPLLFCTAVTILWSITKGRYEHGIKVVAFTITGYMPLLLWRHALFRSLFCFRSNASLLYHQQITALDLLFSRVVLEIFGCAIAYLTVAFIFFTLDLYEFPKDWGLFYLGWMYHIFYALGTALIMACVTEMYEWTDKLIGPVSYIMVPLCGFLYMVDWLPQRAQKLALFLPSVNAYELVRAGQFGTDVRVHYDLGYLNFVCLGMVAVGMIMCRHVRHYIVIE
jgi:capsular polysaccharide transport system permease protein